MYLLIALLLSNHIITLWC